MKICTLMLAVFLCSQSFSQTQTFSGLYVTNNGDTVKGSFPKYTQWARNPDRVEFLPVNGSSIQLTPFNCQKFYVDNYEEYISYSGKRLINPIDDEIINNVSDFSSPTDIDTTITAFLRVVVRTPLCEIFIFNDHNRTNLFYKLPGQSIEELRFKKYFAEQKLYELAEYRSQLQNLFPEEISKKRLGYRLESLSYNEEDIEKFIRDLFGAAMPKAKTSKVSFTILAGVSINFFDVSGNLSMEEVKNNFGNSLAPFLSVGYMLPLNRNFNRFFVYPQLRLFNYKNSSNFTTGSGTHIITYESTLCVLQEVNGGANLVNQKNFHFFLYGGAGMAYLAKNTKTEQRSGSSGAYEIPISKITCLLNLSAGVSVNRKLLFIASYHAPAPVADFVNYSAKHSNLQLGIGYKFR